MPNNNVAILSIMSKFDEKSAREAAKRADKVYEEALSDIGNVNFDEKLVTQFNNAMNKIKKNLKGLNLSSYTNNILDSLFSDKDIKAKSADIQKFVNNIESLHKSLGGLGNNDALKSMKTQQLDSIINKQKKIEEYQIKINEKTEEYTNIANKASKTSRKVSTIDKNYGNQDYSKTLELLKNSLSTEKDFTAEQNQSIENLAKLLNLYQVMEKSEPQKGTVEAIRYSKDLLKVTEEIRKECDKIDSFSSKGASDFIKNNGLDSVNKVNPYTVIDSKQKFINSSIANMEAQKAKMQSELTNYVSDAVKKNLEKITNDSATAIEKAEKKVGNLQSKIENLNNISNKNRTGDSVIGNIISETDIKSLEEIEDRLYAISDLDAEGEATNEQLKEYIQLYKQYEQLIKSDSTVKFDPSLKEEYDFIVEADSKLKKYADTLDETVSKQKELNDSVSNTTKSNTVDAQTEQLTKQEEQIKQTVQAEEKLLDTQDKLSSNTKISVDAEQAIADITKVKESLDSLPEEKKIKISVDGNNNDYSNTPLLSDAEGNTITAFRGVVGAWSGLINQDGIGFFTDKLKLAADYADSLAESGKVYQANLSFKNPLEVEGNGAKWDEIDFNGAKKTTDEIVELAKQLGHDGVIFKNIRDGFTDTEEDISNIMVALNTAQIKNEQVIGTVKAGTGEMVDVANKINSATDTATNSTVENQNKIQEELKQTQEQAEQTAKSVQDISETQIKDVFQGEAEKSGMDAIVSSTEEAVQAKKDFATANESVQSSIDDSKSPLQLEAELMDQIAKSAREAANAKKEFVEANKQVKNSAFDTNEEKKRENTEENTNAWKELTYSIQRYSEVSKRISSGKALEGDIEEASRLENKISQLQKLDILSPTQIEKSEQMLTKLYDSLDDIEKKSKETTLESLNSSIDKYRNDFNSRSSKPFTDNQSEQYKKLLSNYETSIEELESYRDKIRNNPLVSKEDLNQIDELTKKVKESATAFNSLTASQKGSTPLSRGKTIEWANDLLKQNTKWSKAAKIEVQGWIDKLATADPSNVEEIRNRILEIVRAEREAGNAGRTWLDIFKDKKLYSFLGQAASMFSFYDLIRYVREGIDAVKEFDEGLTKISYTMDMTKSQFNDLGKSILDMASDMKSSVEDAMNVAQIYANMQTSAEEIQKLSEPTLILSNLSGFDSSTIADDIQAVTQQFDILAEDSMHIADVYDYISRNIAVDYSKGLNAMAEGLQVAGSTAKQAGLSYEQTASIIAKAVEKTRLEGSQVGNGLKTIMTRLSKVGELSEEVDNETLSQASESLKKVGIEVYNLDGSYREFDVIMGELANKWSDLTDAEKSNISFAIAATRQTNLLSAVLSNFSDSMQLAEEATNANGSALENQQKYMDSFAGHLQSLETEAKIAWINILDSETLKGGVDLLTGLVKVVGQLVDKFGLLGTAGITIGAVQGFKKLDYASV